MKKILTIFCSIVFGTFIFLTITGGGCDTETPRTDCVTNVTVYNKSTDSVKIYKGGTSLDDLHGLPYLKPNDFMNWNVLFDWKDCGNLAGVPNCITIGVWRNDTTRIAFSFFAPQGSSSYFKWNGTALSIGW